MTPFQISDAISVWSGALWSNADSTRSASYDATNGSAAATFNWSGAAATAATTATIHDATTIAASTARSADTACAAATNILISQLTKKNESYF